MRFTSLGLLLLAGLLTQPPTLAAQQNPNALHRSRIACCPLLGKWEATLILDSAHLYQGVPRDSSVSGELEFRDKYRFFPRDPSEDSVTIEFGRHHIDFRRLWGEPLAPEPSTAIIGPGTKDPLTEVLAFDISMDSIAISLSPRFTHGAVALLGSFDGDSVLRGTWTVRGNRSRALGHFTMRRRGR